MQTAQQRDFKGLDMIRCTPITLAILSTVTAVLIAMADLAYCTDFSSGMVKEEDLPPATADAGRLLNEILAKPGHWNQMCANRPEPAPDRVPLFGYVRNPMFFLSKENFSRLRELREAVLAEIDRRLKDSAADEARIAARDSARLFQCIQQAPENNIGSAVVYGVGPGKSSFLDEYLVILLDLQGIEALPGLLHMEAALNDSAPYALDPALWDEIKQPGNTESKRNATFFKPMMHPRLLSVITALLLVENHESFRNSSIYKNYAVDFTTVRIGSQFAEYRQTEGVPDTPPQRVHELTELLYKRDWDWGHMNGFLSIPYDRANRDEIVALARTLLEQVPREEYVGAAAMAAKPERR